MSDELKRALETIMTPGFGETESAPKLIGIKCEMCGAPITNATECHVVEDFYHTASKHLADAIMCRPCQAKYLECPFEE